jgi:hypothetical protein
VREELIVQRHESTKVVLITGNGGGNGVCAGDSHLGGEDFDNALLALCVQEFSQQHKGIDLTSDKKAMSRLKRECEAAKRALSAHTSTTIEASDYIYCWLCNARISG